MIRTGLKRNLLVGGWFLMLLVGGFGCADLKQPMPRIEYYTLEYDPPRFEALAPLPAVIELQPLNARAEYDSNRIIYRDGPFKRDAYVYARWRDNPGDLVSYFIGRDLKASGLFSAVLTEPVGVSPPFRIKGSVDDFFERDGRDFRSAVLAINVTLLGRSESGKETILMQRSYRYEERCGRNTPQGLAEAMSNAMSRASKSVIEDVYERLGQETDGR